MKVKRSMVILVSLILLISLLTACGNSAGTSAGTTTVPANTDAQTTTTQAEPSTADATKITFLTNSAIFPDVFTTCFEKAGLKDKVSMEVIPIAQYENKLRTMAAAKTLYDVVSIDSPNMAGYASMGVLAPLDDLWAKDDFLDLMESSQKASMFQGKIYTAPIKESTTLLFYNKKLFAEAKIAEPKSPEEVWTLDQVLDAAKKLTKKDSKGNILVYGILPTMYSPNNKSGGMPYTQILWPLFTGGSITDAEYTKTDGYFNSEASKKGIYFFSDLYNKYKVAPTEEIASGFESGKIAMWVTHAGMVFTWKSKFPDFYQDWGAMALPKGVAEASISGSWTLGIGANSAQKAEAFKVIDAITGKEGSSYYTKNAAGVPARKSVLDTNGIAFDERVDKIIQYQISKTAQPRPITAAYPQLGDAIAECFNSIAFGEDPDTAIDKAVKSMDRALSAVGK